MANYSYYIKLNILNIEVMMSNCITDYTQKHDHYKKHTKNEIFNMHNMMVAHTTLPLSFIVRGTNLENK